MQVKQYLADIEFEHCPPVALPMPNKREPAEFTDVQLLAYLDQFQDKNQDQDEELQFLLNARFKVSYVV